MGCGANELVHVNKIYEEQKVVTNNQKYNKELFPMHKYLLKLKLGQFSIAEIGIHHRRISE